VSSMDWKKSLTQSRQDAKKTRQAKRRYGSWRLVGLRSKTSLDYRGRVYPVPQTCNPQSDDAGRALLEFARGKPLGKTGAYWLAVHLANLCGKDKKSFDERISWVNAHTEELLTFAREPHPSHPFWTDQNIDKPWSLLAACKEWEQYTSTGPSFESRLAIIMDGTCNGLQHLSAMARDAEGGRATNVSPTQTPSDIYENVKEEVVDKIQSAASSGDEAARLWLGKVTRKLVKRPTMTTPYAVELDGIREQIWNRLKEDGCDDKKLAKGFALDIPSGYGSQKSGVRSQNGGGVRAEKPADFFQRCKQLLRVCVSKVPCEDQKVAAFFYGSLCHIQEPSLVRLAATTESLGDVGRNRYRRPTHLQRETIRLLLGKHRGESVHLQHKPVRLLPDQQILKRPRWFRNGHQKPGGRSWR